MSSPGNLPGITYKKTKVSPTNVVIEDTLIQVSGDNLKEAEETFNRILKHDKENNKKTCSK